MPDNRAGSWAGKYGGRCPMVSTSRLLFLGTLGRTLLHHPASSFISSSRVWRAGTSVRTMAVGSPTSISVQEVANGSSKYGVEIKTGQHTLYGDLMPAAGGADLGPSPKEYVMAAVVSCTIMTMRIYFDAMKKAGKFVGELHGISARCEEYGEDKHLPEGLRVFVKIDASDDFDEASRTRLLAAAGKCPVKRMLTGQLKSGVTTVYE